MSADHGRPRRRRLSDAERLLWDSITRLVVPLRERSRPADPAPAAAGQMRPAAAIRADAVARVRAPAAKSAPKPAPKPVPSLEPLDRRLRQRLARGRKPIDARIDLHGKTQSEAHAALLRFLRRAQGNGAKVVLVITGKGARARERESERGVLKRQVPQWLKLPEFRAYVVGFEDAHSGHGGEGALYVRIRKSGVGSR